MKQNVFWDEFDKLKRRVEALERETAQQRIKRERKQNLTEALEDLGNSRDELVQTAKHMKTYEDELRQSPHIKDSELWKDLGNITEAEMQQGLDDAKEAIKEEGFSESEAQEIIDSESMSYKTVNGNFYPLEGRHYIHYSDGMVTIYEKGSPSPKSNFTAEQFLHIADYVRNETSKRDSEKGQLLPQEDIDEIPMEDGGGYALEDSDGYDEIKDVILGGEDCSHCDSESAGDEAENMARDPSIDYYKTAGRRDFQIFVALRDYGFSDGDAQAVVGIVNDLNKGE